MLKNHIYPEEIRRFEREVIEFVVESGKNKRSSDIESHILAYFLCHSSLTQTQIQEISAIFRDKKISIGSISNFLNQYERYGVIIKKIIPEKRNAFVYALKNGSVRSLMSTGLEAGLSEMHKWIEDAEARIQALDKIKPESNLIEVRAILIERLKELRDFLIFHDNLMKNFLSGEFSIKEKPEIKISEEKIDQIRKKGIIKIEKETINSIQKNPLFMIDEVKYMPIFSYLIMRKRLTQSKLQKLTGLSSGLISEGVNHLVKKGFIKNEKIRGVRKRFYVMPSIGYSNYLKQYQRFKLINKLKNKIERVFQEMNKREKELKQLDGYDIIFEWLKEASQLFVIVEGGIKIFEKALDYFKNSKL